MIFFLIIELLIGLIGVGQLILGLLAFPFGIIYLFSAIPPILLGVVGVLGIKNNKQGKISNASLWILPIVISIGSVGMTFRGLLYLGPSFLTGVANSLWPVVNTSALLPQPLRMGMVSLLLFHFSILVFKKLNTQKLFFIIWLFVTGLFLINLGSSVINVRSLTNVLNVESFNNQELPDGTKLQEKFIYTPEEKVPGGLETISTSETHVFHVQKSYSLLFVSIGQASTQQEAKDLFKKEIARYPYLDLPDVIRKPIDVPGAQGFIAGSSSGQPFHSAFARVNKTIFIIDYNSKATPSPLSSDDFEYFVKAVSKSVTY